MKENKSYVSSFHEYIYGRIYRWFLSIFFMQNLLPCNLSKRRAKVLEHGFRSLESTHTIRRVSNADAFEHVNEAGLINSWVVHVPRSWMGFYYQQSGNRLLNCQIYYFCIWKQWYLRWSPFDSWTFVIAHIL